ncbi:MAG: hypothetical protein KGI06_01355 [Candidatus Micrarchaeota archaeon]|nr:hypothetical protein [Candidatus Micrarchaeota archaeon]
MVRNKKHNIIEFIKSNKAQIIILILLISLFGYIFYFYRHNLAALYPKLLLELTIVPFVGLIVLSVLKKFQVINDKIKTLMAEIIVIAYLIFVFAWVYPKTYYIFNYGISNFILTTTAVLWNICCFILTVSVISIATKSSKRLNYFLLSLCSSFAFFVFIASYYALYKINDNVLSAFSYANSYTSSGAIPFFLGFLLAASLAVFGIIIALIKLSKFTKKNLNWSTVRDNRYKIVISVFALALIGIVIIYFINATGNLIRFSTNLAYMSNYQPSNFNSNQLTTQSCDVQSPTNSSQIPVCNYSIRDMKTIFNSVENILFDTIVLLCSAVALFTLRVLEGLELDL